jgi:branched-chain amino acid transport system permease protein
MEYLIDVLTLAAILAIATQGYMLIKGLGGMLHLAHAVFYGIGAYAAAIASTKFLPPGSFPVSVLIGATAAALSGALVGWPGLRGRGRYFMIVTFAIQLVFVTLVINFQFTGGPDGISSIPGVSLGGWQPAHDYSLRLGPIRLGYPEIKLVIMCGLAALSFLLCRQMIGSSYGRLVRAVREDELVVEAYGREATPVKASILVVGASITGFAGALFAHHFNYVGPTQFELDATILFLVMLIVGGQYSLTGATIGAVLIVLLLEALRFVLDNVLSVPVEMTAHLRQVVFAIILIVTLAWRGDGLVRERLPRYRRPKGDASEAGAPRLPAAAKVVAPAGDRPTTGGRKATATPLLVCTGLNKAFGGIVAVADASLALSAGRIVALIGPNGAGKTSTFNSLSGFETSDGGEALLRGQTILGRSTAEIARLGLARTFQDTRVWARLTAIENLLVTQESRAAGGARVSPLLPRFSTALDAAHAERAWQLLDRFGLAGDANVAAGQLSYAQRKMLGLARIACFGPQVMLLDEPTSGVDPRRLGTFLEQIKAFAVADGRAVCLIEHNMTVVRELADEVVFMDEGRVIATGTPAEILGDRQLMRVYLGHRELRAA